MLRYFCLCLALAGCTGTDYIADPPMMMMMDEPQPTLVVSPGMAAIEVGQTQALEAAYLDTAGVPIEGATITWSVSNEAIATVDGMGVVSGVREGQVSVTARVGDTVSEPVMVGVAADPAQVALVQIAQNRLDLSPDDTAQLTAQSVNARGEALERTFTWRSSDPAVATVDASGRITAVAPGQATITAEVDGVTSNAVRLMVQGPGRTGMFVPNPDSHYACEGTATMRRTDDGGLEVVFGSDFLVSRGPRLEIILSTANRVGPGSVNIGPIQAHAGAQTYSVPPGIELTDFDWVIIHCVPFNVTFGWAQLQ